MGFEPLVNQRLLPPSFPRYTAIFGREQVSHKHSLLCSSFLQVTRAETITFITGITIKAEQNKACIMRTREICSLVHLKDTIRQPNSIRTQLNIF